MEGGRGTTCREVIARVRRDLHGSRRTTPKTAVALGAPALPWFEAIAELLIELADKLKPTHGAGRIHGNIKPFNVLVHGDGRAELRGYDQPGERGAPAEVAAERLVGAAAYLAPEQVAAGQRGHDPLSDVYQLGALMYELLTLRRAFDAPDMKALLTKIERGDCPPPPSVATEIPRELAAICEVAMAPDSERRYQSAAALGDDLAWWLSGSQLPWAVSSRGEVTRRQRLSFAFRRRRGLRAVAGALVLGLVFGAWLLSGSTSSARRTHVAKNPAESQPADDTLSAQDGENP